MIVRDLFLHGQVPQHGALLELGEANWYGDVAPQAMVHDIQTLLTDPARQESLIRWLSDIAARDDDRVSFDIVKVFYEIYFAPSEVQAVDLGGTAAAHRFDLNRPMTLNRRFDVVINHGTAEHIFNIGQVFETIHQYTVPGGLMIHESPFRGWIDHGFYNLQPKLFFDVAEQNQYGIVTMIVADIIEHTARRVGTREAFDELAKARKIPENSALFTVMTKGALDRPFQWPRIHG
jgi:hypothetical protein